MIVIKVFHCFFEFIRVSNENFPFSTLNVDFMELSLHVGEFGFDAGVKG